MAAPVLYPRHFFEAATITVTGEATGLPKARLADRELLLAYQDAAATGTREIKGQVAGNTLAPNRWIVPSGHNLAGASLSLESSPDGATWTVRDALTGDAGVINRPISSPPTVDWWRLTVTGAGAAPLLHELYLTASVTLPRGPDERALVEGPVANRARHESIGGKVWSARLGPSRWRTTYLIRDLTAGDRTAVEAAFADLRDGARPFYLLDADGVLRWIEWLRVDALFQAVPVARWDVTLEFQEVL